MEALPTRNAGEGSTPPRVLVLCTGNAARSVMAGAMLRPARAEIVTAGTHVVEGQPMSRRTRDAMVSVEASVDGHRSRQVTDADVASADLIVALAGEHVAYIRRRHPDASSKTATLRRLCRDLSSDPDPLPARVARLGLSEVEIEEWEDVEDPAGAEDEAYVSCARCLVDLTADLVPRLR